jgi:hypothetical protein
VGSPARISAPIFWEWQREWNGVIGAEEGFRAIFDGGDDEAAFNDGDGTFDNDDDDDHGVATVAVTPPISTTNRGRCVSGVREAVVFRTGAWADSGVRVLVLAAVAAVGGTAIVMDMVGVLEWVQDGGRRRLVVLVLEV